MQINTLGDSILKFDSWNVNNTLHFGSNNFFRIASDKSTLRIAKKLSVYNVFAQSDVLKLKQKILNLIEKNIGWQKVAIQLIIQLICIQKCDQPLLCNDVNVVFTIIDKYVTLSGLGWVFSICTDKTGKSHEQFGACHESYLQFLYDCIWLDKLRGKGDAFFEAYCFPKKFIAHSVCLQKPHIHCASCAHQGLHDENSDPILHCENFHHSDGILYVTF